MRNIQLTLEYDGTAFFGWQVQPGLRTVQGVLEAKLSELLQEKVSLIGAGRTDAGVHALGQAANFRTEKDVPLKAFCQGLNRLLPKDVAVLDAREVKPEFHARFDARSRLYRYRIITARSPLRERFAWHVKYALDFSVLDKTGKKILGRHDFTSFSSSQAEADNFEARVSKAKWRRKGDTLTFEIEADRFLHNMVRILVGTMVDMARGKIKPGDFPAILKARDRRRAGRTAPPQGLFLVRVTY
jgi:tRNA pseudouridine38-40 synthase